MKKILVLVLAVLVIGGIAYFVRGQKKSDNPAILIQSALASAHDVPTNEVQVMIGEATEHYWKGGYSLAPHGAGDSAGFYASDTAGEMNVVWRGQEAAPCSLLREQSFPEAFMSGCYQE